MDSEAFKLVNDFLEEFRKEWNDLRHADSSKNEGWDENIRYHYEDLTPEDLVWDIGAYEGEFAARIHCKYGCRVRMFEILPRLNQALANNFRLPAFTVEQYGLGPGSTVQHSKKHGFRISDEGDRTSMFIPGEEMVEIERISDLMTEPVALMKMNVEGEEYELIDDLALSDKMHLVKHLQIQFHYRVFMETGALFEISDARYRYQEATKLLKETHKRDWGLPWVWEGWSLKEDE